MSRLSIDVGPSEGRVTFELQSPHRVGHDLEADDKVVRIRQAYALHITSVLGSH